MSGRLSVLVVAGARSGWSAAVARWAAGAVLPIDVVRCVSPGEVHARLDGGRAWSALLADATLPGVDRDLVGAATRAGCPVLLVDADASHDHAALGAAATIGAPFSRDELLEALAAHARPVAPGRTDAVPAHRDDAPEDLGPLVAVLGPGGTGTSTTAVALAQGLADPTSRGAGGRRRRGGDHVRPARDVLLVDLCRRGDQAVLHDTRTLAPGLREVVEAHRTRTPEPAELRDQAHLVEGRDYHLLLGLRRPSHWTALPTRGVDAALDGLRASFEVVVADCDPDVEGEDTTGSFDVEERHHLTRAAVGSAAVVVLTFDPSTLGCAKAVRLVTELLDLGVAPERLLPACVRAPRSPRARAEVATTLADLLGGAVGPAAGRLPPPLGVPDRPVDTAIRDAVPLPAPLPHKLASAVTALLGRTPTADPADVPVAVPVPVVPGELGLADGGGDDDGGPSDEPAPPSVWDPS